MIVGLRVAPPSARVTALAALSSLCVLAVVTAGAQPAAAQAPRSPTPRSTAGVVRHTVLAEDLDHPWALAFLPDGRMLVTERPGRLRVVDKSGKVGAPISGLPGVHARGQGGLLDVAVDPDFARTSLVYFSYAEAGEGGAGTAVARAPLRGDTLGPVEILYRQVPKVNGNNHFGSRLVFTPDGKLFITQGDRYEYRAKAQDLGSGLGKVIRINLDGSVPKDNPFAGRAGARPEIWSYGHRNVQSAALDPATGELWTVEHGARGGDELNNPRAGKNYGWPVITYGIDYSGAKISEITAKDGMEQPVYYWDPVIAPSGMAFYTGDAFPGWKGSILVGSMNPGALVRLEMKNGKVVREERYLGELGRRVRDVAQGPDGFVYLVTDERDGQLIRVEPAAR